MGDQIDIEKRITSLEKSVQKLEENKKDRWDKFKILASLLIPASITIVGIAIANAQKKAEIAQVDREARLTEFLGTQSLKAEQATLVSTYLDTLTSDDPQKRRIAIAAVGHALGDDGKELLKVVVATDPDPLVRQEALRLLQDLGELGYRLRTATAFSNTDRDRAKELIQSAEADPSLLESELFRESLEDILDAFFAADLREDVREVERVIDKMDDPPAGIVLTLVQFFGFEAMRSSPSTTAEERFSHYAAIAPEQGKIPVVVFRAGFRARDGELKKTSDEIKEIEALPSGEFTTAKSMIDSLAESPSWQSEEMKAISSHFSTVRKLLEASRTANKRLHDNP